MKKLLPIIILMTLATTTSCLKKQNLDDDNLGPAISPESLSKAMLEGFGSLDYGAIKANEFSSYVLTQKIQDSYVETIEQQDMTIKTSTDTSEKLSMDLILSKIKYSGGQSSQSTREWQQDFYKSNGKLTSMADNDPPTFLFVIFQSVAFGACHEDDETMPESCHQLSITDFQYRVPQTALAQHSCTNPDNCFINARKIEFDLVQKTVIDKDGKPRRIHYTIVLSKEVPYLSRVIQFCSRSLYEMTNSNQKILADLCYNVNNYAFGN